MQSLNPHSVVRRTRLVPWLVAVLLVTRSEPWHHSPRSRFEGGADRSSAGGVPEKAAQGCVSQRRAGRYDEGGVPQTVGQVPAQRGPSPCTPRAPDRPVRRDGRVGSRPLRFESLRFNDERKKFKLRAPGPWRSGLHRRLQFSHVRGRGGPIRPTQGRPPCAGEQLQTLRAS